VRASPSIESVTRSRTAFSSPRLYPTSSYATSAQASRTHSARRRLRLSFASWKAARYAAIRNLRARIAGDDLRAVSPLPLSARRRASHVIASSDDIPALDPGTRPYAHDASGALHLGFSDGQRPSRGRAPCLAAGMDNSIAKPRTIATLRAGLARWLPWPASKNRQTFPASRNCRGPEALLNLRLRAAHDSRRFPYG